MSKKIISTNITSEERNILRELAKKVAEIGNMPRQEEMAKSWRDHNDLKHGRAMVLVFPEGSWREIMPESTLLCKNEWARKYEHDLRMRIYYHEHLQDDNVIEPVVYSPIITREISGWGLELKCQESSQKTGAYHIEPVILNEEDVERIESPQFIFDEEKTDRLYQQTIDVFGDILAVQKLGECRGGICPLDFYAQLRGIDNLFMDMVDRPKMVHRAVEKIVLANIEKMRQMENLGILSVGLRNHYSGSGGTAYTHDLPQSDFDFQHVRTIDIWGFAAAQIFSEVSPAMHEEFALSHEREYLKLFGLNSYGCCEPLHNKLDTVIRNVPRLRRVSISPWANVEISSQKLEDKYIFSYKPNPADLAGETWQPERIRKNLWNFCEMTRGNIVEIIMKDTHTIRNEPHRICEWVRIAKEVTAEFE